LEKLLEHKHLIVRAELQDPPYSVIEIKNWMIDLVKAIDMNILMGPYAVYSDMPGNQGLTAVTIIETSHIALHVWDEVSPALAQLDVYTCSSLDIEDVFNAIKVWNPSKVEYKYINRETGLTLIEKRSM
jgi:S-adenosylmethionine/arginine decarboxylase-like enzyme